MEWKALAIIWSDSLMCFDMFAHHWFKTEREFLNNWWETGNFVWNINWGILQWNILYAIKIKTIYVIFFLNNFISPCDKKNWKVMSFYFFHNHPKHMFHLVGYWKYQKFIPRSTFEYQRWKEFIKFHNHQKNW